MLLKDLNGLRQNSSAIQTLGRHETDLAVSGIELVQALKCDADTVTDPVIVQVAKDESLGACSSSGHEGRSEIGSSQDHVLLTIFDARLPQILAVAGLELSDQLDRGIVENPNGVLAVRRFEGIVQIHQLVCSNGCCAGRSNTDSAASSCIQDSCRLGSAVSYQEGLLFLVADPAGELRRDIALQVECGISSIQAAEP